MRTAIAAELGTSQMSERGLMMGFPVNGNVEWG